MEISQCSVADTIFRSFRRLVEGSHLNTMQQGLFLGRRALRAFSPNLRFWGCEVTVSPSTHSLAVKVLMCYGFSIMNFIDNSSLKTSIS